MYPICEPVEYASTFLISLFTIPCVASSNAVMAPVHAITSKNWSARSAVPAAVLPLEARLSAQFPLNEWLLENDWTYCCLMRLIHAATMVKAGVFLVARIGPLFFALGAAGILAEFCRLSHGLGAYYGICWMQRSRLEW